MGEINVSFQIDTDNRENFSSAMAFHTFKKQRDAFYDILRIWEVNHLVPGWVFQIALGGKIRNMLTLHNDCTNYYHIARLFKSQLLTSCIQNGHQDDVVDDESLNFLKALKHVNPEKLTQLSKRFVTPLPSQNQSIGPSFPGTQEFFKDFILHAFNPIFYTHLENCFVHEIMELNDTQFANSEIEDSETMVDDQTQQNFITCLASLRLLAKVLGLLISLPYRSECNTTKEIIITQVEIRSKVLPSLNLQACLQNAIIEGKLSLTIPWVVKYLAMMDIVSLRLPYYKQILELLYYIYHAINQTDLFAPDCLISQQSAVLLKSSLCWLFELPNFPRDFYVVWQKNCKIKELKSLKQIEKFSEKKKNLHSADCASKIPIKSSLDKLDIITDRTMRMCCPRMESTLSVFQGNGTNLNINSNKHITPVTSKLRKLGGTTRAKHLELQLEEAFFHGQPASTRKTVDFVSERVASTCVKHICNTLLASSREANLNCFRKILKHKHIEKDSDEQSELLRNYFNEFKASLVSDMNTLANNASRELKDQCEKTIPTICEARVAASIESLLAEDSLMAVKEMCIKIATRMAMERINQWIQSHIAGDSLFIKDMELEINRFFRNSSPIHSKQEKHHNTDTPSPTVMMDKELIWHMLDNHGIDLTISSILDILDKLYHSFNQRSDLLPGPQKVLYNLSMDFALFLVAYRTDLFTQEVQDKLIKIWSLDSLKDDEDDSPMHRILCSRNIMLLTQPRNDTMWPIFGKFLKRLLETKILDGNNLSDQCVALFRQDWPVPLLKLLSKCLSEAIEGYKATDEATEKVKYLLGWVVETYHEIDFCEDDL
ncbi:codanin-1-like isoform X2 [Monomorium pharaonis]|uniref:codanin-1 isoform X2 n=1 Tax=Monomorium pharaonis TaxID=307658 RepID=UPI00063EDF43|nr:codanin-1 isoform X2 [Monomorium pharaonis]XP_036149989.1 codanin-1-like isoform X2 [Monomorium pharaonis]